METKIWDLDNEKLDLKANEFLKKFKNSENKTKFNLGEKIQFFTGYNNDILAKAIIKAIDKKDIYVYTDSFWFPIQDDTKRKIKKLITL